jgi:hypothetical protein
LPVETCLDSAERKAVGIDVHVLVDERNQVRALLLDPVKRGSLARPFWSDRVLSGDCCSVEGR